MTQDTPATLPITLAQSLAALEVADSPKAISNFTGALIAKLKDEPAMIPLAFGVADWLESRSDPRMNINAFELYTAGLQALKGKYCVPDEATHEEAQALLTQQKKDPLYKQIHKQVPQIIKRVLATFEMGHEDKLLLAASDCGASCFTFDPTQASPELAKKMVNILLAREIDYFHPFELLHEMATENPVIFQTCLEQIKEGSRLDTYAYNSVRVLCIYLGESSADNALTLFQTIHEIAEHTPPQNKPQIYNVDAMLSSVADIASGLNLQWREKTLQPAIDLLGDCLISADSQHTQALYASPFAGTAVTGLHALAGKCRNEIEEGTVDRLLRRMPMLYAAEPKKETAEAIQLFCGHTPLESRQQAVRETIGNVLDKRPDEQKRNILQLLNGQSPYSISYALIAVIVDDTLFEKIATCAVELDEKVSFDMANRVLKQQGTTPERGKTLVSIGAAALSKWFFNKQKAGLSLIETALDKFSDLRDNATKQIVTDFLSETKNVAFQNQAQRILNLYGPPPKPEVKEEPKPQPRDLNVELNKLTQQLMRSTSKEPAQG